MERKQVVIYANKRRQKRLQREVDTVITQYDHFFLAHATSAQIETLQKRGIEVEEMTSNEQKGPPGVGVPAASSFDPPVQGNDVPSPGAAGDPFATGRHHYKVTFVGPIKPAWLQACGETGAKLRDAVPPRSYIMEIDAGQLDTLAQLPFVQHVEHYQPTLRIAPEVETSIGQAAPGFPAGHSTVPDVAIPDSIESPAFVQRGAAEPFQPAAREDLEEAAPPPAAAENVAPPAPPGEADIESPERHATDEDRMHEVAMLPSGVMVMFYTAEQLRQALPKIQALSCQFAEPAPGSTSLPVMLPKEKDAAKAALDRLANIHGIKEISPIILRKTFNDVASFLIGAPTVRESLGLNGEGEIIGVADTGLDKGQVNDLHPDFDQRVIRISSWPVSPLYSFWITNSNGDDGPADLYNGHGTHVAASAMGNGEAAIAADLPSPPRGVAPAAKLFFQAIQQKVQWNDQYVTNYQNQYHHQPAKVGLFGLPPDIEALLDKAYAHGVRIHNNSWGGGTFGAYDAYSEGIDRFVWKHRDFLVLVAAGNYGRDHNGDGQIDNNSIMPPGTAKNVITVGAAESKRPDVGIRTSWGRAWPHYFANTVSRDDPVANNPAEVAAFSGRGPTRDGRIKPDLIAPGTNIVSARSRALPATAVGWGRYPPLPSAYMVDGGTSMATPMVSGAAALVRQFLRRRYALESPPADLLKALLIHSSQYEQDPLSPGDGPSDYAQGWGHINLGQVLRPQFPRQVHWRLSRAGLQTGAVARYYFPLYLDTVPLQVTLAWSDYPARANQPHTLVNDLDLIVISPTGKSYHGNIFQPPYSQRHDRVNNVEQVFIQRPLPGRYIIAVRAFNVMMGPQPFALVYSGATRPPAGV